MKHDFKDRLKIPYLLGFCGVRARVVSALGSNSTGFFHMRKLSKYPERERLVLLSGSPWYLQ